MMLLSHHFGCLRFLSNTISHNGWRIFPKGLLLTQYFPCIMGIQFSVLGGGVLSCRADDDMAAAIDARLSMHAGALHIGSTIE
jgi:hypothetical protein